MLIDTWYPDNVFGIPGDEDGGGTTGFVVFSMLGFFPVTPGIPVYAIGSPTFNEASIKLPSGKTFTVKAINNSAQNVYIQSAVFNEKKLEKSWFTHTELLKGGTLTLQMGNKPNRTWGAKEVDAPPSAIAVDPGMYR